MDSEDTLRERMGRAQSQDMETHLVDDDPVVVEVDNHDSVDGESTHTVIPDALYCSCWDHRSRQTVCKHMMFVATQDTFPGQSLRWAISDHLKDLNDEQMALEDRLDEIEEERSRLRSARTLVADHVDPTPNDDVEESVDQNSLDVEDLADMIESLKNDDESLGPVETDSPGY